MGSILENVERKVDFKINFSRLNQIFSEGTQYNAVKFDLISNKTIIVPVGGQELSKFGYDQGKI